jgi:putative Mg2+ transporter-C (MgtC) family protein
MTVFTVWEMIARLVAAAVLGGLVGYERERHDQPAGLRTHTILSIGASLAMMLSILLAARFRDVVPNGDPARLAAQVISGIGFLGAGAIIRYGPTVRGLTTATSLWTVAIVGLGVGAGEYVSSAAAVVLLLITLDFLDRVEKRFIRSATTKSIKIGVQDRPGLIDEIEARLGEMDIDIKSLGVRKDVFTNEIEFTAVVKVGQRPDMNRLIGILSEIQGVKRFEVTDLP